MSPLSRVHSYLTISLYNNISNRNKTASSLYRFVCNVSHCRPIQFPKLSSICMHLLDVIPSLHLQFAIKCMDLSGYMATECSLCYEKHDDDDDGMSTDNSDDSL